MHGELRLWGRTDTALAVVRKDSESMQTPLALSRKTSIIVCTVMLSVKRERLWEIQPWQAVNQNPFSPFPFLVIELLKLYLRT